MMPAGESYSVRWWLMWLPSAALLGFSLWRYMLALRNRPVFKKAEITYQEFFASGNSQRNLFTKLGGARNCLRLVVARDFLWVTSWFPFSLFAPLYDMEHVIPLENIVSVKRDRFLGIERLLLNFVDKRGMDHSLRLSVKNEAQFLLAMRVKQ